MSVIDIDTGFAQVRQKRRRKLLEANNKEEKANKKAKTDETKTEMTRYALFSKTGYLQSHDMRSKLLRDYDVPYEVDKDLSTPNYTVMRRTSHSSNEPDIVVAYRGTSKIRDMLADGRITVDEIQNSPRYIRVAEDFEKLQKTEKGKTIVVTGHSLGGSLAGAIGAMYHVPSITFNPGSGASVLTKDEDMGNSIQYTTNGSQSKDVDLVSWLSAIKPRKGEEVITVTTSDIKRFLPKISLKSHSLTNFLPPPLHEGYYEDIVSQDQELDETTKIQEVYEAALDIGLDSLKQKTVDFSKDVGWKVISTILSAASVSAAVKKGLIKPETALRLRALAVAADNPVGAASDQIISGVQRIFNSPVQFTDDIQSLMNAGPSNRSGVMTRLMTSLRNRISGSSGTPIDWPVLRLSPVEGQPVGDVDFMTDDPYDQRTYGPDDPVNVSDPQDVGLDFKHTDPVDESWIHDPVPDDPNFGDDVFHDVDLGGEGGVVGEGGGALAGAAEEGVIGGAEASGIGTAIAGAAGEIGAGIAEAAGPVGVALAVGLPIYFQLENNEKRQAVADVWEQNEDYHSGSIENKAYAVGYNPSISIQNFIDLHPETASILKKPDGKYDYDAFYGKFGVEEYLDWRSKNLVHFQGGRGIGIGDSLERIRAITRPWSPTYVQDIITERQTNREMYSPAQTTLTKTFMEQLHDTILPVAVDVRKSNERQNRLAYVKKLQQAAIDKVHAQSDRLQDVFHQNIDKNYIPKDVESDTFRWDDHTKTYVSIDKAGKMSHKTYLNEDDKKFIQQLRGGRGQIDNQEILTDNEFTKLVSFKRNPTSKQVNQPGWHARSGADAVFDVPSKKPMSRSEERNTQGGGQPEFEKDDKGPYNSKHDGPLTYNEDDPRDHRGGQSNKNDKSDFWLSGGGEADAKRFGTDSFTGSILYPDGFVSTEYPDGYNTQRDLYHNPNWKTTLPGYTTPKPVTDTKTPGYTALKPSDTITPPADTSAPRPGNRPVWRLNRPPTLTVDNGAIGGSVQPLGQAPVEHTYNAPAHPSTTPAQQVAPGENPNPFHSGLTSESTFGVSGNGKGITLRQIHQNDYLHDQLNQMSLTMASDVNFMRALNRREGNW